MQNPIKKIFKPRLKLVRGTRLTSFLFIATSVVIAGAILFAANIYYNIDTGEIVMEEIQRVTNIIRATAGLIVGGTASQNPSPGYVFEVVGKSKLATTTISSSSQLEFPGSDTFAGFKAPSDYGTSTEMVYILPQHGLYPPQENYVLTWTSGNQLKWQPVSGVGAGDITAVGDCPNGDCFTGISGSTLWFKGGNYTGALTIASLSNNATYTLPAVSGTYYFPLISGTIPSGQILFGNGDYTLGSSANLTFDTANRILTIGTSGNSGELRIYNGTGYLGFAPASAISSVTYRWPGAPASSGMVLTSDTSGNLSWQTVSGVGAVTGQGQAGYVAFWDGISSLTYDTDFAWSTSTNTLTIGGTIIAAVFRGPDNATTTIVSAAGQNILLDPASGKIYLGSGDYIIVGGGYEIGKPGTQILKELVPIFGFDLPVKTATTSYVKISRTIVNYPLNPCEPGTQRVHKLVIRYGATATSSWQVATSTSGAYPAFQLPPTAATSTGSVYTAETSIPVPAGSCTGWNQGIDTDDWWVQMKLDASGEIMIYQIFLAGYDQIL